MYVAATTRAFSDLSFGEALRQIEDLEFDRFELCLNEQGSEWTFSAIAERPDEHVQHLKELTRLTPVAIDIAGDVDRVQFQSVCRFAKLCKITQLTIPASSTGAPYNTEIDRLKDLVAIANQESVLVSLKTQSGTLTEDPHTAAELCQSVKGLRLTLDPSYYMRGNAQTSEYDILLPHVSHTHLRDSTPTEVQVMTGLGEIDYNRLISQLNKLGYRRALSVDLLPELTDKETRGLEFRKLRLLLESLL
ncbi:MAG TPA: sugar phosphate isomerase/epimerase [Planctomycetaceae bacterium]|nr:sugar phosphate isomerase/epimerase [Planctomycetaceae bacterium]